jgi:hypothetical protein
MIRLLSLLWSGPFRGRGATRVLVAFLALLLGLPGAVGAEPDHVVLAQSDGVARRELTGDALRVALHASEELDRALAGAEARGQRILLLIHDVRRRRQTDTGYSLYWNLPPGERPAQDDPRFLGTISFYDVGEDPPSSKATRDVVFDIGDLLEDARHAGQGRGATITFLPDSPPAAGSASSIGKVELIAEL